MKSTYSNTGQGKKSKALKKIKNKRLDKFAISKQQLHTILSFLCHYNSVMGLLVENTEAALKISSLANLIAVTKHVTSASQGQSFRVISNHYGMQWLDVVAFHMVLHLEAESREDQDQVQPLQTCTQSPNLASLALLPKDYTVPQTNALSWEQELEE